MSELIMNNFGVPSVPMRGEGNESPTSGTPTDPSNSNNTIVTLLDTDLNPIYPYTTFDAIGELDTSGTKYTKAVLRSAAKRNSSDFLLSAEPVNDVDSTKLSERGSIKFITSITSAKVDPSNENSDKKLKYTYITYQSIYENLENSLKPDLVTNNIKYSDPNLNGLSDEQKRSLVYKGGESLTDIIKGLDLRISAKADAGAQGPKGNDGKTPTFSWSKSNKYSDNVTSVLNIKIDGKTVSSQELRGPKGDPGKSGTSVNLKSALTNTGDLKNHEDGKIGDAYLIGRILYVYCESGGNFVGNAAWNEVTDFVPTFDVDSLYRLTVNGTPISESLKGADGSDGIDGQDGHSPKVEVRDDKYIYIDDVKQQYLKGDPGTSVNIKGAVQTEDDLNGEKATSKKHSAHAGDGYILGDDLWVYPADGTEFIKAGKIRGPQGPRGADGSDGHSPKVEVKDDKYIYIDDVKQQYLKGDPGDPATATSLYLEYHGGTRISPDSSHNINIKKDDNITISGSESDVIIGTSQGLLTLKFNKQNKTLELNGTKASNPITSINLSSIDTTYKAGEGLYLIGANNSLNVKYDVNSLNINKQGTLEVRDWDKTKSKWEHSGSLILKPINDGSTMKVRTEGKFEAALGFFETSDARLKDITSDLSLEKSTEFIRSSHTVNYTLKSDSTKTPNIGLIAQEVEEYFPEVIESRSDGYKSINYAKLGVVLFPVVKDLLARVEALEVQLSNRK